MSVVCLTTLSFALALETKLGPKIDLIREELVGSQIL